MTTGANPIYEVIDGEKVATKEYQDRYMNEKVEQELVEFKKEIEEKFSYSKMNATYVFKRTEPYRKARRKEVKSYQATQVQPTYSFNEKILIKNLTKYERAISGEHQKQNRRIDEINTFDYQIEEPIIDDSDARVSGKASQQILPVKHNGSPSKNLFENLMIFIPILLILGRSQKETPVIVDMKKAVKGSKNKDSKRRPHANNKIMNFDFTSEPKVASNDDKNSSSTDNIIADAFSINENSPSTVQSKLMPYQDMVNNEITKEFTMYQNYQDFGSKQDKGQNSHSSFQAKSDFLPSDSNRLLSQNPYEKGAKKGNFSCKKSNEVQKQAYVSAISNPNFSHPNSGQRTPTKVSSTKALKAKNRHKKMQRRNRRNMSGSIESAEAPHVEHIYTDVDNRTAKIRQDSKQTS